MSFAYIGSVGSSDFDDAGGPYTTLTFSPSSDVQVGQTLYLSVLSNNGAFPAVSDNSTQAGATNLYVCESVGLALTYVYTYRVDVTRKIRTTDTITFDFTADALGSTGFGLIVGDVFSQSQPAREFYGFKHAVSPAIASYTPRAAETLNFGAVAQQKFVSHGMLTTAAGSSPGLSGHYYYKVTFDTPGGELEGNYDPNSVFLSNQKGSLSTIAIGPAGTTARKIYRTTGSGLPGTEKLAGTISDNTTTVYLDSLVDGSLGASIPFFPITPPTLTLGGSGFTAGTTVNAKTTKGFADYAVVVKPVYRLQTGTAAEAINVSSDDTTDEVLIAPSVLTGSGISFVRHAGSAHHDATSDTDTVSSLTFNPSADIQVGETLLISFYGGDGRFLIDTGIADNSTQTGAVNNYVRIQTGQAELLGPVVYRADVTRKILTTDTVTITTGLITVVAATAEVFSGLTKGDQQAWVQESDFTGFSIPWSLSATPTTSGESLALAIYQWQDLTVPSAVGVSGVGFTAGTQAEVDVTTGECYVVSHAYRIQTGTAAETVTEEDTVNGSAAYPGAVLLLYGAAGSLTDSATVTVLASHTLSTSFVLFPAVSLPVAPSRVYTASAWVNGPTGAMLSVRLYERDASDAIIGFTEKLVTLAGGWQRVFVTRMFGASGVNARMYVCTDPNVAAQAITFYIDGVQIEQKAYATPYVNTNGAIASRGLASVQVPSAFDETQGWAAFRVVVP